jgi:hypothetical protein
MLGRDGIRDGIGLVCPKRMEKTKCAWRVDVGVPGLEEEGYGVPVGNLVQLVVVKWCRA